MRKATMNEVFGTEAVLPLPPMYSRLHVDLQRVSSALCCGNLSTR